MRTSLLRQGLIWGLALAGLAGIFVFLYYFVWLGEGNSGTNPALLQLSETDWRRGNPEAKIVLIEYSDFQCPACAYYFPLIKQLLEQKSEKILFVYRHFPLSQIHPNALLAAYAAEAAGNQGRFWEMSEKLFLNQEQWAESKQAKQLFLNYAGELGLDQNRFLTDLASEKVKDKVFRDLQSAFLLRLKGTPTFFLNGKELRGLRNFEELRQILTESGL